MARRPRRAPPPAPVPAPRPPLAWPLPGSAVALSIAAVSGVGLAFGTDVHATPTLARGALWSALRAVHLAAASGALALLLVAAAEAYVRGVKTRALLAGALLLGLLLAAFESGVVLPFDQRASEAWRHVRDGAAAFFVPLPEAPDAAVRSWLVVAHVLFAAAIAWPLVTLLRAAPRLAGRPLVVTALLVAGAVLALAAAAPPVLGPAPIEGLAIGRPHWPFLWLAPLQTWWGPRALALLPVGFLAVGFVAWRTRAAPRLPKAVAVLSGGAVLLGLTWWGAR